MSIAASYLSRERITTGGSDWSETGQSVVRQADGCQVPISVPVGVSALEFRLAAQGHTRGDKVPVGPPARPDLGPEPGGDLPRGLPGARNGPQ